MVDLVVVLVEKMNLVVLVVDLLELSGEDNTSVILDMDLLLLMMDNVGNVSVALNPSTTTWQNSNFTSTSSYQGWIRIQFIE